MKANIAYLDANFFIASQITSHPFYNSVQRVLTRNETVLLCYSILTLDEVLYTFTKYKTDKEIICKTLKTNLLDNPKMIKLIQGNNPIFYEEYLETWKNSGLKPRDAMHLHYMQQNHITKIATFDEDFIKNKKKLEIEILK